MSNTPLIEAVKAADINKVKELLHAGHNINEHGTEQEWPALNFAAGKGDLEMIALLLSSGANIFNVGRDNRTPYNIALAAGCVDACMVLRRAEEQAGGDTERISSRAYETRPYCKAYPLGRLRQFPGWKESSYPAPSKSHEGEAAETLMDDSIVFIHQDHSVTRSMWWNEDVVFGDVTGAWKDFCLQELEFRIPHDFDLVPVQAG